VDSSKFKPLSAVTDPEPAVASASAAAVKFDHEKVVAMRARLMAKQAQTKEGGGEAAMPESAAAVAVLGRPLEEGVLSVTSPVLDRVEFKMGLPVGGAESPA